MSPPPPPPPPSSSSLANAQRTLQTPAHSLLVYSRPLHPELFALKARKALSVRGAEFEAWLMPSAHMLRYQNKTHCYVELVTENGVGLPTNGVLTNFPAVGEKDHEQLFGEACLLYTTSVQTENLTEALYMNGLKEMRELAEETSALVHEWRIPEASHICNGRCLSMLEVQRFEDEVHAQSTHMFPVGGLVLRTQSVFQRV